MISIRDADRTDIARVMFDPEIWDRATSDKDGPPENYDFAKANLTGWTFLGCYVDGKIAGLFIMRGDQLHFWVLKEHRQHARGLLRAAMDVWGREVWCEIPALYRSVINFAKKFGFTETGINRACHIKRGRAYDTHVLRYKWAQ